MEIISKKLVVFALFAAVLFIFGCTMPASDKSIFDQLSQLKQKYSAVDSLPTNNLMEPCTLAFVIRK